MVFLQDWIHKLEVGPGIRYLRVGLACFALLAVPVAYDWVSYRNLASQEAMDAAQVARNLSEGKGFTTLFIRPFSLYLVGKRSEARFGPAAPGKRTDYSRIKDLHPDLANPPVYPTVLAGLMKVLPFDYTINPNKPFWGRDGKFWRYEPDFLIALFNQFLFFVAIVLTFFLARYLFDAGVAWLSGILLLGCELLWRFSVAGLSTLLLAVIFLGLVWCLVFIEREAREPKWRDSIRLLLAAMTGLLAGVGALTRYSFGWVMIPVLVFLILFSGPRKAVLCLTASAVFAVVLAPWVYRNYGISGAPFGTAGYAIIEATSYFPEYRLERSLNPNFSRVFVTPFVLDPTSIQNFLAPFLHKFLINSRDILQNDLPRLGGSWVTPFFLVGLMVRFHSPAIRRLRYFTVMCLCLLVAVQALGRTQLSEDVREINSENLLVLLVPLVLVYGVSLFYVLLDQINLQFRELRYLVVGLFAGLVCLPMAYVFLPPRTLPVVYPPYYPPEIQQTANWMKENELMMSDIPWAMAWYGKRPCVWVTLNAQSDFFAINDFQKPIQALYLTPQTMDGRFLTQWVRPGEYSWGSFVLECMARQEIPTTFPLRNAPPGFLPERLFLTDWERWKSRSN